MEDWIGKFFEEGSPAGNALGKVEKHLPTLPVIENFGLYSGFLIAFAGIGGLLGGCALSPVVAGVVLGGLIGAALGFGLAYLLSQETGGESARADAETSGATPSRYGTAFAAVARRFRDVRARLVS